MAESFKIWVLTDDRAGNIVQAEGLAAAIARRREASVTRKEILLARQSAWVPPALSWRLGARAGGWPFSGITRGAETLVPPWPDLIIGAGRRVAPVVAALGRLHRLRTVQLLNPQMPARAFDAVVVPRHDSLQGPNVLSSIGALNALTPERIGEAAAGWAECFEPIPRPRVAVLIGGPSRSSRFGEAEAAGLADALEALAETHGLLITPSRRTPVALTRTLGARLGARAFIWDGAGENPYPAILGHADAVLVTADSVNMASEAASTGLPVHVFPVTGIAAKIARFHEGLAATGASRPFTGAIGLWSYAPLAEADRIAAELAARDLV